MPWSNRTEMNAAWRFQLQSWECPYHKVFRSTWLYRFQQLAHQWKRCIEITSFSISFLCQFIAQTFTNRSCELHLFETSDQLMSSTSPQQPLWWPYLNFKSLELEQVWEILMWSDDVFIWFMDGNGLLTVRLERRFLASLMEIVDTGNSFDFLQEVCQYIIISLHTDLSSL